MNGRASDELCNTPCTGNKSQICGGEQKNSIHLISYQTEVSNDSPWKLIAIIFIAAFLLNCLASCFISVKYFKIKKSYDLIKNTTSV